MTVSSGIVGRKRCIGLMGCVASVARVLAMVKQLSAPDFCTGYRAEDVWGVNLVLILVCLGEYIVGIASGWEEQHTLNSSAIFYDMKSP